MGKRGFFFLNVVFIILFITTAPVWAAKNIVFNYTDLNYHYKVDYIGSVVDFSNQAASKITTEAKLPSQLLLELSIESIYSGFDWIPMNPLITDNNNHVLRDYKVIVEPPAGEKTLSVKYVISPAYKDSKWLTFYEEGLSDDGKKAYRVFLRNIPLPLM